MTGTHSPCSLVVSANAMKIVMLLCAAAGVVSVCIWAVIAHRRGARAPEASSAGSLPGKTSPQSLAGYVAFVVISAAIPVLAARCDAWHRSQHRPTDEHRRELLEAVSKQLHCPLELLTVSPVGSTVADVKGCGGSTRLCWRQLTRLWPLGWRQCD